MTSFLSLSLRLRFSIESKRKSDGSYIYSTTNLTDEFPGDTNARNGLDPQKISYCILTSTTTTSAPSATTVYWSTDTCPTDGTTVWTKLSSSIAGSGVAPYLSAGTAYSWTLCARIEQDSSVLCRSSLTR